MEGIAEALEKWLAAFGLPPEPATGEKDLKGQTVRVSSFPDEEALQFFFPKRTVPFHQTLVKKLTGRLRKRGATIERVPLTAEDFARWLDLRPGLVDSFSRRYEFATRPPAL